MAKRADRVAAKRRAQERERLRRQTSDAQEPGPEEFGFKIPPKARPGERQQRPDFSGADWDKLQKAYPRDAKRLKRAMYIAFVGERRRTRMPSWSGACGPTQSTRKAGSLTTTPR